MNEAVSFPDVDDGPLTLAPGTYLVELALARAADPKTLAQGLAAIGFSDGDGGPPALDASQNDKVDPAGYPSRVTLPETAEPALGPGDWQGDLEPGSGFAERHRFVGCLRSETVLQDTDDVRWTFVGDLLFDPFVDIRQTVEPFPLENGASYDVRFISRMKAHATRQTALEALAAMGFRPLALSCLKKNIRLNSRSGTDCALWCGRVVWQGPKTVLTVEDPLSFEDVVRVKDDENDSPDRTVEPLRPPGDVSDRLPGIGGPQRGGGDGDEARSG